MQSTKTKSEEIEKLYRPMTKKDTIQKPKANNADEHKRTNFPQNTSKVNSTPCYKSH